MKTTYCCRVVYYTVAGTLWLNEGVLSGLVKDMLTPSLLRKCIVGRGTAGSTASRHQGTAQLAVPEVMPRVAVTLWLDEGA